jgi:hypothetical protein
VQRQDPHQEESRSSQNGVWLMRGRLETTLSVSNLPDFDIAAFAAESIVRRHGQFRGLPFVTMSDHNCKR